MQRSQAQAQETLRFKLVKLESRKVFGTIGDFLKRGIFNNIQSHTTPSKRKMCPVSLLQTLQVAVGEEVQHRSARRRHLSNGGPNCLYRMMPEKERQRKRRVSNTEINRGCWMLLKFNPNHLT